MLVLTDQILPGDVWYEHVEYAFQAPPTEALRHKVRDFLSAEGVLNSDAAERFRDLS